MYAPWMYSASSAATNVKLGIDGYSYDGVTSSEGLRRLANGSCHFACLDTAPSRADVEAMPSVWVVPMLAQAVAIIINVPELPESVLLNITRAELADIFLGRIKQWAELAQSNAMLQSVRQNISLVVRADDSVVSLILSSALSSFSQEWAGKVGASTSPKWPSKGKQWEGVAFSRDGDAAVSAQVLAKPYSLGYVSATYIKLTNGVAPMVACISNKAGRFMPPTQVSVLAAMEAFAWRQRPKMGRTGSNVFYRSLVDPPEEATDAYPMAGYTYLGFNPGKLDCAMLHDVMYLLVWSWRSEQAAEIAVRLGTVPVPAAVYKKLIQFIGEIRCDGKSALNPVLKELLPKSCLPGNQIGFRALEIVASIRRQSGLGRLQVTGWTFLTSRT